MELATVAVGKRIGYTTGDPLRFLEDIQVLKPDFVSLVPRVLNRLYQSIIAAAETGGQDAVSPAGILHLRLPLVSSPFGLIIFLDIFPCNPIYCSTSYGVQRPFVVYT